MLYMVYLHVDMLDLLTAVDETCFSSRHIKSYKKI